MENINTFKAALAALGAALTALWGWFGWVVLAWIGLMLIDYITGSAAALRAGKWSSSTARLLANVPGVELPFTYSVLLCPLVVMWYILTEAGSIIENAGELGAPVPAWLTKMIAALESTVDEAGEYINKDQ